MLNTYKVFILLFFSILIFACSNDKNPSTNNDTQLVIAFEQINSTATEGTRFTYRLELNKESVADVNFDWSLQHISTSASDFTGIIAGTKRIRAWNTIAIISLYTSNDSIYEGDESFIVHITNVTGATPSNLSASSSIIDNDSQPTIAFEQADSIVAEGTDLVYRLQLTNTNTTDVTFDWSLQHHSTSTSDFTGAISGLKTISAGDTTATITLRINDDNLLEPAENFTLSITNITGAIPDSLEASITILASDVDNNGNGFIDITTQEQLHNIRYNLAGTSYKTSASDADKTCGGNICRGYELLANIVLSTNWQPIGSENNPFTSILQGNGYSIANLVIDGGNYLGLFAALAGATIDNLVVEVASITGDSNVGALAGSATNSTISRLQIRAASTSSKLQARGASIGGILGAITEGTTITNVTSNLSIVGGDNVGGIVGYVLHSAISYATSNGSITNSESGNNNYGGLVGLVEHNSTISYSSASGSVTSSSSNNLYYGGLVGVSTSSDLSYSSASGSVTSSGSDNSYYGGLVGEVQYSSIRHSSASGNVIGTGNFLWFYGGFVGYMNDNSTINDSSVSGNVSSSGSNNNYYGGFVGYMNDNSAISYSGASGSVASSGRSNDYYGGLVGYVENNSAISYSSASASVSSNGNGSNNYGGLAGSVNTSSNINYTSASGNVSSNGNGSNNYGGLVGHVHNATISYSSASGSVISRSDNNGQYGGLVGSSRGEVQHSWSSGSVFASSAAGLMGLNTGNLGFSYALGAVPSSGFGLIAENTNRFSLRIGTVAHSYWNNETSGALEAAGTEGTVINIASSDTVGMLASTGSATSRVFKGFLDATDELNRNIWSFASDSYPVITQLGVEEQAVALAYGLLRLASSTTSDGLASFLGGTLNNEDIELIANSYNANDTLAILDINLLQSNSAICVADSTGSIMTTTGANQALVTLSINAESSNLLALIFNTDCSIDFNSATSISAGDRLQLAATITKGSASLTKNFVINFR